MDIISSLAFLLVGVALGGGGAWLIWRNAAARAEERAKAEGEVERMRLTTQLEEQAKRIPAFEAHTKATEERLTRAYEKITELEKKETELVTTLEKERDAAVEKLALVEEARQKLSDAFSALSREALDSNSESFLRLAKSVLDSYQESAREDLQQRQERILDLVGPVKESLDKVDNKIQDLERRRAGAYGELKEQITQMADTQQKLKAETANLVKALRSPSARGRWGEIQLKRVVELAGMVAHCDFCEQASVTTEDGRLRPDMIVNLPAKRTIVVDSKVPLEAYLDALEAVDEETRREKLKHHARQLRKHISELSKKSYWDNFQPSPEFVLLFLPSEMFYSAALEHDPSLIEDGASNNVIIATPATLIALLKAAAYGWKQEALTDDVRKISTLGRDLYERLATLSKHIVGLGKSLSQSVKAYNDMIGSMEGRVLVGARRFKDLKVTGDSSADIDVLTPIENSVREVQAPELTILTINETNTSDEEQSYLEKVKEASG